MEKIIQVNSEVKNKVKVFTDQIGRIQVASSNYITGVANALGVDTTKYEYDQVDSCFRLMETKEAKDAKSKQKV